MEQEITLIEMLDARERRVCRQQRLLERYQRPLICFTMNIAGPVKNSPLIRRGFLLGKQLLQARIRAENLRQLHDEEHNEATGNEAYFVLDAAPLKLKRITADIEDGSALGRLFDMDVLKPDGEKVDRAELGLSPRLCFLCEKPAKECARSRAHSVSELQEKTTQILSEAVEEADVKLASELAMKALLYEVCTTPKPGLVDRNNSGSHRDMDIFTFIDSTCALRSYFEICTRIGKRTAALPAVDTFEAIRPAGRKAEADMFSATNGVNTHKGAIFSIGILCAALGRLPREAWNLPEQILDTCAAMTQGLTARDFAGLTEENAVTTGQKLYLKFQINGIRGQIEAGLPAVRRFGLPVLKEGLARGLSVNDAGCAALLSLLTADTDTNLIARSDIRTQKQIVSEIKALLAETPYPDKQILEQLDKAFIEKNLSPGGSADLLAICYLLYFLEQNA